MANRPAPRLHLIDGSGYVYRAFHALPALSTSRGLPTNAVLGFANMLSKLLREERPDHVAVVFDAPGGTFRDTLYAAYKETRGPMPDELRPQIPYIRRLVAALRLPVIEEPGVIRHTAMAHLLFGELDGSRSPRLVRLLDACEAAGFQSTLTDRIEFDIWAKFVRLATFSGMTCVTRSPIGPLRDDPDLFAMLQAAILEGMKVAHAKGISLPKRVFDEALTMTQALPPQAKSSMLEDLERGNRLELPWLSGAIVRIGSELDVETPIHRFIATVLKPHVAGRPH